MRWKKANMSWESFCEKGLNDSGTLVEVEYAVCYLGEPKGRKEKRTFLIGDINRFGGTCDDCTAFERDSLVVRYKKVV